MAERLFPIDIRERTWAEFPVQGLPGKAAGAVYRGSHPPVCGMPLGGIGTGCLDLEATGLLGYCSIFNSIAPRRGPLNQPFLGLSVGGRTWLLTTLDLAGRRGETAIEKVLYNAPQGFPFNRRADILTAQEIHYFGHYPVVDCEYETTAPLQAGLRAWSPFIPGDVAASSVPGAVFEVHLRNPTAAGHSGTLVLSFPGPNEAEAGTARLAHNPIDQPWMQGVVVTSPKASYVLGVLEEDQSNVRWGGSPGIEGSAWGSIHRALPPAGEGAGCALAVDFTLESQEQKTIRFVLAWYSPHFQGGGSPGSGGNTYTHHYAASFGGAVEVAQYLAVGHARLLQRILAWQAAIYGDPALPAWLRSDLINNLHLITEDSLWAQARAPIGDWCRQEDGLFGMIESPHWCPQIECIPCSFYGNIPLVLFFPELALSTLRGYKAYQYPDGQAPWVFGGVTVGSPYIELAMPSRGYSHKPQATLDGPCYVDMVDRLWQRTGSREILAEFYASVKKNTVFTMNLRPGSGAAGIVSMPAGNLAQDWFESTDLYGIVPHIGGAHLAQLRMAGRMAQVIGDGEFAAQCQQWIEAGSRVMEENTWAEDCYLLYSEPESQKKSGVVMGYQLDGEWMARYHGLPGVFDRGHVATTLATFCKTCIPKAEGDGAVVFSPPVDRQLEGESFDPGYWGERGIHPPSAMMLAMTYLYADQKEIGIGLARGLMTAILEAGWSWDIPSLFEGGTRIRRGGFDYYQNMMLWALPAAIQQLDLQAFSADPQGLVSRILQAGRTR